MSISRNLLLAGGILAATACMTFTAAPAQAQRYGGYGGYGFRGYGFPGYGRFGFPGYYGFRVGYGGFGPFGYGGFGYGGFGFPGYGFPGFRPFYGPSVAFVRPPYFAPRGIVVAP